VFGGGLGAGLVGFCLGEGMRMEVSVEFWEREDGG
jgi:hypothetical protein